MTVTFNGGRGIAIRRRISHRVLFCLFLFTTGCATAPEVPEWPVDMPPRSYYESLYNSDPYNREHQSWRSYSKWVRAFYEGWGGIRGWRYIREEILGDVNASKRESMRGELEYLGKRISGEWAKAYDRRVINGRTVQVWIDAAYLAGKHRDYERLLKQVSGDVDALLAGKLDPAAITLQRYYPDTEPPPSFDDFTAGSEQ